MESSYPQNFKTAQDPPQQKKAIHSKSKLSFDQFFDIYVKPLKTPNYEISLPASFTDICAGWQSVTFRQIIVTMTKSGSSPLPLIFTSPEHMKMLSNKHDPVQKIFKLMDYRGHNRVDALELISGILLAVEGKFEHYISNVLFIFGFTKNT